MAVRMQRFLEGAFSRWDHRTGETRDNEGGPPALLDGLRVWVGSPGFAAAGFAAAGFRYWRFGNGLHLGR